MLFTTILSAAVLLFRAAATERSAGFHSTHFDEKKYMLAAGTLLLTPDTHPHLYHFSGRWLRSPATVYPHVPAYQATLWPGTSVTVLIFGETAAIKLRPKPQGLVELFHFAVSIDGGPDVRYNTDGFNTSSTEVRYVPIEFDSSSPPSEETTMLRPHTLRITSISATPLSFEGVQIQNTLIKQATSWVELQSRRPVIEFIGEGIDTERPGGYFRSTPYEPPVGPVESPLDAVFSTVHYQLGQHLSAHHSHMAVNTCLLHGCDSRRLPGLTEQYFYTSPLSPTTESITDPTDPRHRDNVAVYWRFPPVTVPDLVVVDVGIRDILTASINPDTFQIGLIVFLARLRQQAYPKTKIVVIGHRGAPRERDTVIEPDFTSAAFRMALFTVTSAAVQELGDSGIVLATVQHGNGKDPKGAYLKAVCPHLLSIAAEGTRAQWVCEEVMENVRRGGLAKRVGGVFVFLAVAAVAAGVVWLIRKGMLTGRTPWENARRGLLIEKGEWGF